jgi:hypothetical protein
LRNNRGRRRGRSLRNGGCGGCCGGRHARCSTDGHHRRQLLDHGGLQPGARKILHGTVGTAADDLLRCCGTHSRKHIQFRCRSIVEVHLAGGCGLGSFSFSFCFSLDVFFFRGGCAQHHGAGKPQQDKAASKLHKLIIMSCAARRAEDAGPASVPFRTGASQVAQKR